MDSFQDGVTKLIIRSTWQQSQSCCPQPLWGWRRRSFLVGERHAEALCGSPV